MMRKDLSTQETMNFNIVLENFPPADKKQHMSTVPMPSSHLQGITPYVKNPSLSVKSGDGNDADETSVLPSTKQMKNQSERNDNVDSGKPRKEPRFKSKANSSVLPNRKQKQNQSSKPKIGIKSKESTESDLSSENLLSKKKRKKDNESVAPTSNREGQPKLKKKTRKELKKKNKNQ